MLVICVKQLVRAGYRYDVLLRDLLRFVPKLDFLAMTNVVCSLQLLDHKKLGGIELGGKGFLSRAIAGVFGCD